MENSAKQQLKPKVKVGDRILLVLQPEMKRDIPDGVYQVVAVDHYIRIKNRGKIYPVFDDEIVEVLR